MDWRTPALGRGTHAKDRVLRCDRLELAERCPPVDGEVCARAACHLEVSPQDRRALAGLDFLEENRLAPSVSQYRPSAGGPHVGDPVGAFTEHRDEIPLAIEVCDDNGERPQAPAAAPADLERCEPLRPNARRVQSRLSAVEQTCEPVRPTTGVEPASRGRAHRAHVASLHHVRRTDIGGVPQRSVAHYETPLGIAAASGPSQAPPRLSCRGRSDSPSSHPPAAATRAKRHSGPSRQDRSQQAIARAEAMRGKRGTAGHGAHALPMQEPGQEGLGRADARRLGHVSRMRVLCACLHAQNRRDRRSVDTAAGRARRYFRCQGPTDP